jgi:hypothetical protein
MKTVVEFTDNENKIELKTSGWGAEEVYVNDVKKSDKYSFFGSEHEFKVGNDNYKLDTSLSFSKGIGVNVKLLKNDSLVDQTSSAKLLETMMFSALFISFMVYIIFKIVF